MGLIENIQKELAELRAEVEALKAERSQLPEWVSNDHAAELWGVSPKTVSWRKSQGDIPAHLCRRGKIRRDYVEARMRTKDWREAADMIS